MHAWQAALQPAAPVIDRGFRPTTSTTARTGAASIRTIRRAGARVPRSLLHRGRPAGRRAGPCDRLRWLRRTLAPADVVGRHSRSGPGRLGACQRQHRHADGHRDDELATKRSSSHMTSDPPVRGDEQQHHQLGRRRPRPAFRRTRRAHPAGQPRSRVLQHYRRRPDRRRRDRRYESVAIRMKNARTKDPARRISSPCPVQLTPCRSVTTTSASVSKARAPTPTTVPTPAARAARTPLSASSIPPHAPPGPRSGRRRPGSPPGRACRCRRHRR